MESSPQPSFFGCPRLHLRLGMCLTGELSPMVQTKTFQVETSTPPGPAANHREGVGMTRASLQPGNYQRPRYRNDLGHNTNEDTLA